MNSSATLGSATSTAKAGTDASMCSQNIWDRRPARENRKETRWPALSPGQPLRRKRMSSFRRDCARRNVPELRGQSDGDALHARWGSPPDNSLLQHGQPAADANGSRQGGAEGVCLFLDWCLESEEPGGGAYAKHDPPDR